VCGTEFYERVLGVAPVHAEQTHVVLPIGDGQVWLHAIPAAYASTIVIASPPEPREDAAVKLSFPVASLTTARHVAISHGGGVAPAERAWELEGTWHIDGWEPEGNVIQFRAPIL